MKAVDFTNADLTNNIYGGTTCPKLGVSLNSTPYMLKFPKPQKVSLTTTQDSDYSLVEVMASQLMRLFGVQSHKTVLGRYKHVYVAACVDFNTLHSMHSLREFVTTFKPLEHINYFNPQRNEITNIITILQAHPILHDSPDLVFNFYRLVAIDAIFGNRGRNTTNIALQQTQGVWEFTPIYANANSLFVDTPDDVLYRYLEYEEIRYEKILEENPSPYIDAYGKPVDYFRFLKEQGAKDPLMRQAVGQVVLTINEARIDDILTNFSPYFTPVQINFFKQFLMDRINYVIYEIYNHY